MFFTGSARGGASGARGSPPSAAIPVVAELSGCDAVVALESADAERLVDALVFGMRLNGSATCMAPRRLHPGRGGAMRLLLTPSCTSDSPRCDGIDVGAAHASISCANVKR